MKLKTYIKRGLNYILNGVPQTHINTDIISLSPSDLLSGRTAIITGGTSGIGFSIAEAFIKAGAMVIITGRNKEKLDNAVEYLNNIHNNRRVFGVHMDITDIEKTNDVVNSLLEGALCESPIDILVNNAGVMGRFGISSISEKEFDDVVSTNIKGPFFLSSLIGQYMKNNNIKGNILNIASSSLRPANSVYGISKWGLRGFTQGLAKALIPYGITVNGLAPGPTATPMILKDIKEGIQRNGIFGRYIMPEEIANMAVVLVSGIGKAVVGDTVFMTGGAGLLTNDDIPCIF